MAEESQTQTQTQGSQVEWSQGAVPSIPVIWGRLYLTPHKYWPENVEHIEYLDLIQDEFKLGRALECDYAIKKDIMKDEIVNVSKMHFVLRRDSSVPLSPAVLVDYSYNGTFVNGEKVGKGKRRVLDDKDEISITHPNIKLFVFKDHMKNEQDQVPREVSRKYYISRTLGQGACGVVKLVYNKLTCEKYAMKIIKKSRLTAPSDNLNNPKKIENEVNILRQIRHPFIISTEEIFDSRSAVYIVLELAEGGELFERITKLQRLPERQTKLIFRQMVLAVHYLHSQGITHRDLKPENVLLVDQDSDPIVKISDFGLSKFVGEDTFMKTMCGTPLYLAPEVLRANGQAGYGPEVDVWSLGVIFFICLSGYLPFSSDYKDMPLRDQILQGRYTYSKAHWNGVSLRAKVLMRRMLTVRPERRITLPEILQHDWMQDEEVISRVDELLGQPAVAARFSQMSVASSTSSDDVGTLTAANPKRMLSNDSSCEPVPKKMRLGARPNSIQNSNKENHKKNNSTTQEADDTSSYSEVLIAGSFQL